MSTRWVLHYETKPEMLPKARELFPRHRARIDEFHARGVLTMVGTLGKPPSGAMGVFTTQEAAEEFLKGDPFVLEGVVSRHTVWEWSEIFT
ncbi:MAG TPA: YciI family protein [Polyangiaceae bacterium]|nr:YciI family protein [Polyangiaceae bacterium]